jgi:hypothetical protein
MAPFDIKAQVVHGAAVPNGYLMLNTAYAALYILALVSSATFIFMRRDFK